MKAILEKVVATLTSRKFLAAASLSLACFAEGKGPITCLVPMGAWALGEWGLDAIRTVKATPPAPTTPGTRIEQVTASK